MAAFCFWHLYFRQQCRKTFQISCPKSPASIQDTGLFGLECLADEHIIFDVTLFLC